GPMAGRRLAPGRLRLAAGAGSALPTALGMVEWIHRHAAHRGTLAPPAALAGLADILVLVLDIADLAHGRVADDRDPSNLARRHPGLGVGALASQSLRRPARGANQLAAATGRERAV